jgi:hypothetical protein
MYGVGWVDYVSVTWQTHYYLLQYYDVQKDISSSSYNQKDYVQLHTLCVALKLPLCSRVDHEQSVAFTSDLIKCGRI